MRLPRIVLVCILSAATATGAQAQSRLDFERCRAIVDNLQRLECYDRIDLSQPPPNRGKYEPVPLAELAADALGFRGRFVEVTGRIAAGADLFQIKTAEDDPEGLPIDLRALAQRDRQAFEAACSAGCNATVQGRVGPVGFTTGIAADLVVVLGS